MPSERAGISRFHIYSHAVMVGKKLPTLKLETAQRNRTERSTQRLLRVALFVGLLAAAGCGTTKSFTATEQLLVSDAVDTTVAQIDFRPLTARKVFIDNTFMPSQKGVPNPQPSLVHSEYVLSSLRQQMTAAGVMLCDKREDADVVVEVRLGALGFDGHTVSYGIPASSALSSAANTLSGTPAIPAIPEISFARKEAKNGAAKIALFAYERTSLQPVWQSGIARASSSARDTWVLGVGPLQNGTIYQGARFAGGRLLRGPVSKIVPTEDDDPEQLVDYKRAQVFVNPAKQTETAIAGAAPNDKAAPGTNPPANATAATGKDASSAVSNSPAPATPTGPSTSSPSVTPASGPLKLPQPPPVPAGGRITDASPTSGPVQAAMHIDDKQPK